MERNEVERLAAKAKRLHAELPQVIADHSFSIEGLILVILYVLAKERQETP